ncbi:unnamed protein product [Polarella glacialis]|uniref:Uncharacterized protein n=1 Tax=Polarella glacialis TaxID=89957 RepID=A0A813LAE6_POLGL|nr:unnamed protein product [Polarella glacialis]
MDSKCVASGLLGGLIGGAVVALLLTRKGGLSSSSSALRGDIKRILTADPRMSKIVVHNGYVHISGQVGDLEQLAGSDIAAQTRQTLAKVDELLAAAGTDRKHLLEGRIWVKDIARDFAAMNAVWNDWIDSEAKPTRFCVQSEMAKPEILVEVQVLAVLPE